jgi:hypothetical protein
MEKLLILSQLVLGLSVAFVWIFRYGLPFIYSKKSWIKFKEFYIDKV